MHTEDPRRVIACINACSGLDTEALEQLVENGETLQLPDKPSDVFVLTFAD